MGDMHGTVDVTPTAAITPEVIIITGMSGAGRTEAMHTFEDMDYFCIDNLPPALIVNLVSLAGLQTGSLRKLAVVCDLRTKEFFPELIVEIHHLDEMHVSHVVLFLDATDESLLRRFSETRRRHPLCEQGMSVQEGISREREMLSSAREMANFVLDTTNLKPQELRKRIRELFNSGQPQEQGLNISVMSFGFKHGSPQDADIVMDVRFLPNPYYDSKLRGKTGLDHEVSDFVLGREETQEFLACWFRLLDTVMPGYVAEGKHYLSIAIGCTGGQHRSVVLAEKTGVYLISKGYPVTITHRDLPFAEV